jgi:hypothetical protein
MEEASTATRQEGQSPSQAEEELTPVEHANETKKHIGCHGVAKARADEAEATTEAKKEADLIQNL